MAECESPRGINESVADYARSTSNHLDIDGKGIRNENDFIRPNRPESADRQLALSTEFKRRVCHSCRDSPDQRFLDPSWFDGDRHRLAWKPWAIYVRSHLHTLLDSGQQCDYERGGRSPSLQLLLGTRTRLQEVLFDCGPPICQCFDKLEQLSIWGNRAGQSRESLALVYS